MSKGRGKVPEYTVKKSTVERYDIRPKHGYGWGIFTIDEKGWFACQSDYGDYKYHWTSFGDSFKSFLCRLNKGYFLKKAAYPEHWEFKPDESVELIKEHIIENRLSGYCNKDEAREAWDFIDGMDDINSADLFVEQLYTGCDVLTPVLGQDLYEFASYGYDVQAHAFFDKLWPMFIETLKNEIGKERGHERRTG